MDWLEVLPLEEALLLDLRQIRQLDGHNAHEVAPPLFEGERYILAWFTSSVLPRASPVTVRELLARGATLLGAVRGGGGRGRPYGETAWERPKF